MPAPSHSHLILMYHGLSADGSAVPAADPHYTLSTANFVAQLEGLAAAGVELGSARDLLPTLPSQARPTAMLTFDDGDASNFGAAFPALLERGLAADFFVNPARVGRPGFCSWAELREMAGAGMSIQSHGHSHTYFTALSPAALREELRVSKAEIEQQIGQPVSLLAPPGGRSPRGLSALARALGYQAVLGSAPGAVAGADAVAADAELPRLALTHAHTPAQVLAWSRDGEAALRPLQRRYRRLAMAKRVLGDRGYEGVRALALGLLAAVGRGR